MEGGSSSYSDSSRRRSSRSAVGRRPSGAGVGQRHSFHAHRLATGMTKPPPAHSWRMFGERVFQSRTPCGEAAEFGTSFRIEIPGYERHTKPNGCARIRQPVRFVFQGVEVLTLRDAGRLPE